MVTTNPGIYFRELMPHYARAAKICELVYSNISKLFKPEYDAGGTVATIITLGGDFDVIQCRCLLGYFKPTIGGTPDDVKQSLIDFNLLLKNNKLFPHDFTGSELSDAEHFYASAVITMVPILGLAVSPIGSLAWDLFLPEAKSIDRYVQKALHHERQDDFTTVFERDIRYDVDQLIGPDLAGHRFGMSITYGNNIDWWFD